MDDSVVNVVKAKEKIGSIGDLSNIKKWQKKINDKYYTKLISTKSEIIFKFYRNKEFFKNLFSKKIDIKKPFIKLKPKKLYFELSKKYAILFIVASAKFKKWDVKNFVQVGKFLKENYGYEIVLCGTPSDIENTNKFKKYDRDLVGRTFLIDLLYVISTGNYFGRFTSYSKEITTDYYSIYYPEIEKNLDDYKKFSISNSYGYGSKLNIKDITLDMVLKKIKAVLG